MKVAKYITVFVFCAAGAAQAYQPTFADLAVFWAKGFFGSYVNPEASMERCVEFLNQQGVCFSFFDLMDGSGIEREDFARVFGQSNLLCCGEAEILNGSIKKPVEAETWVDYCLLNDIDFEPAWDRIVQLTAEGSLPEVREYFKK
ncbi:MAG: hypothetical protein MUC65_06510 [Pontiellaceae bacterium]|jgi:hypothetical protein|nr:hypothetical protein [Pontiellaceae bacterium]